jgi:hypothetical protein
VFAVLSAKSEGADQYQIVATNRQMSMGGFGGRSAANPLIHKDNSGFIKLF